MEQVFKAASDELKNGNEIVVATVVKTSGSTPQKPGAKLLVRSDGSGVGTLGGGCVEGDIWFASSQLLKDGGNAEMRDYELNEDLAAQDGLVCGGTMYFLLDPIRNPIAEQEFSEEAIAAYDGGSPVAIASLMKQPENSTLRVGAKLLINENGATKGSLGNKKLDSNAVNSARSLMAMGKNDYFIDQSGAIIMTTVAKARELGISKDKWVFLHGCSDVNDHWYLSDRKNYFSSPAMSIAGREAFEMAECKYEKK